MAITDSEWRIVKQHIIQTMIEVVVKNDDDTDNARLTGIVNGGNIDVNSGSSVRRTASFSLIPTQEVQNINEKSLIWLNKRVEIHIGILDQRNRTAPTVHNNFPYKGSYKWWKMGVFLYNNANATFDASNNILSIELSDQAVKLDGTTNGQMGGALTHIYKAYEEDPVTGQPISYTTIKKAIEDTLKSAHVSKYSVQNVGEYYGMPQSGDGYLEYRQKHPLWNMIPYDLDFSAGATVWDVISELTQLYPSYDAAFDENGRFVVEMIPTEYSEECDFYYEDYKDMVISEQVTTDLTKVFNICEVWGESLDADGYAEGVSKGASTIYVLQTSYQDNIFKLSGSYSLVAGGDMTEEIEMTIYENLSTEKDFYGVRIHYENGTLSLIACQTLSVLGGSTFQPGEVINSCSYGETLPWPTPVGAITGSISEGLTPPHSDQGRFVMGIEGYKQYRNGDRFGVKFSEDYEYRDFMQINELEPLGIVDASTRHVLAEGILDTDHIHVFQLVKIYRPEFQDYNYQWYYVGVSQSHALDVLTDGTSSGEYVTYIDKDTGEQTVVEKYSEDYFKLFYNCDTVSFTVCPDSPFTIQKLGERLDVKAEGEFNNIRSNQLAMERAQYENWKNSRITDNLTITTKLMPFVKPYMKIDYKKHGYKTRNDFIVQAVSHDLENGTTTIQMYTFYPLYKRQPGDLYLMTYKYMSGFLNGDLYGDEDLA